VAETRDQALSEREPHSRSTESAANLDSERVPKPVVTASPASVAGTSVGPAAVLPGDNHLNTQLDKATRLLAYAAEAGIYIADEVRNDVLKCRSAPQLGWSDDRAASLLSALTRIAAQVQPVTAEALEATENVGEEDKTIRFYKRSMYTLFAFLIPFSIATFCTSKLSEAIQTEIGTAHQLAVKLNNELYRPAGQGSATVREAVREFAPGVTQLSVIEDLTQLAQAVRSIDADARKLNVFVLYLERPPFPYRGSGKNMLELDPGLTDLGHQTNVRIQVLQQVRYFARSVQNDVAVWYGAVASCILPLLYAILGALAYLLRSFERQVETRTLRRVDGHTARFAIAAIGGFVVGLFNVSIVQNATISPLAIAFLVGYAADVFFSFLEGLIQTFGRSSADGTAQAVLKGKSPAG
jgi:hypothetical protein